MLNRSVATFGSFVVFSAVTVVATAAFAVGSSNTEPKKHHRDHSVPPEAAMQEKPLEPATRYSGRAPIDLTHGLPFNNGTYGLPNKDYEVWAQSPVIRPNVSELTYPYARQGAFVNGLRESADFITVALNNWQSSIDHPTEVTKPEVLEYAKASIATLKPILEKFDKAVDDAKGASRDNWETAQTNARKALEELRGTYTQLHKNP